ncbi:CASP-like protein 4B2 [Salvia splendens]|uniref:CASP-like protein 4B2 n=1 Tax=Salvia splendens TaxID=180675 RepID=UPI001C25B958|nr:CASP-like protein 4B2 [Salvia splendens]
MGNEPTPTPTPENVTTHPAPAATDLESGGLSVDVIMERWKTEDLLQKCSLASRVFGFIFSFLTLIIMATNIHGDWRDFYHYEEYRYVLVVAILSTSYASFQSWRQIHKLATNKNLFSWPNSAAIDYGCDQVCSA